MTTVGYLVTWILGVVHENGFFLPFIWISVGLTKASWLYFAFVFDRQIIIFESVKAWNVYEKLRCLYIFLSYHLFRPLSYSISLPLNLVLHVICECIVSKGPAGALDVDFVFFVLLLLQKAVVVYKGYCCVFGV